MKKSPLTITERKALAKRIRKAKGDLSYEDRLLCIEFLECLTWIDDHWEYMDTDGEIIVCLPANQILQ